MRLLAKLSIPAVLILVALIANFFLWHQAAIGTPFLLGYAMLIGYSLGRKFFPNALSGTQTFIGALILLAIWSLLGAAIFYFGKFDSTAILIMLISPLLLLPGRVREPKMEPIEPSRMSFLTLAAGSGFIMLIFSAFFLLARSSTSSALRSPWERVPAEFFFIFFLASLALLLINSEKRTGIGRVLLISGHAALMFSVALIVFEVGFGFDPIIHRATENYIFTHGTIAPKPPYYAGEYGLLVFLAKMAFLPVSQLNKFFLPLLSALTLPFLTFWALGSRLRDKGALRALAPLAPFCLLLFPLSSFISTTPQGLANYYLLLAILLAYSGVGWGKGLPAIAIFVTATLLTHPLSGIPAAIFLVLLSISKIKSSLVRWSLSLSFAFIASMLIPITFVVLEALGRSGGMLNLGNLTIGSIFELLPKLTAPYRYNFFLDLVYLYLWNKWWVGALAVLAGLILLKKNVPNSSNSPFIFASFAVLVNSILLASVITFPALIDYEQGVYAERLREIAMLFLLPLAITGALWFFDRAKAQRGTFIFALILLPGMMTASLYLTYPRTDKYESTHGYNTSLADIHAVEEIEADAKGEKYIVLANQAVGAAALQEFGFVNFYKTEKGEVYFYSVPTGGPLYQFYLKMVYPPTFSQDNNKKSGGVNETPSRKTMREAMDLADVKLGYIAINHYWTNARRLTEDLAAIAEKELIIDGGRVYVYRFRK